MVAVAQAVRPLPRISAWNGVARLQRMFRQPIEFMVELAAGGEVSPFINNKSFFLNMPQLASEMVVSHAADVERSTLDRGNLVPLVGESVLTTVEPAHRRQRKLLAPAFNHKRVMAYGDTMAAIAERQQQSWGDGAEVELHEAMVQVTLEVVAQALFGASIDRYFAQFFQAMNQITSLITVSSSMGLHAPRSWPTPSNLRFRRALRQVDAVLFAIIQQRRGSTEDRGDFLSMLLETRDPETGQGMDDQQIRDEAMTIFMAGHETTANALSWTWDLLMRHPEVYERLAEETSATLNGRSPTVADLPALPYVGQVFKEAMRLYPPVWFMDRQVIHPLELAGYRFPAGTLLVISPYTLHRKPEYFPDPERFDPERFAPGKEDALPRMAYMPFGDGPRVCLGNHFAQLEAQLILATLAQRVRFVPLSTAKIPLYPVVTLRPGGLIRARVQRR
ncbi:MAG: cytochrome P450 [Ktedonobacterales bacterium]